MQKQKFRGFKLFFANREAAESMVRQIDEFPSFFTPSDDRPLVIDAGANIGVSMLEWKIRWPGCQILCFEPDPFAFKALQRNVDENDLPGVRCYNVALSDHDGSTEFYGDLSLTGDARGNSIDDVWGNRDLSQQTTVPCKRLSPFIADNHVSFLKLDIEGAEQRVLAECRDVLQHVQAIYVEIHETNETVTSNSQVGVIQILREAGFTLEVESRYEEHALPPHLHHWQQRVGAKQSHVLGWR